MFINVRLLTHFVELLYKSFEDLENPEAKMDALGRKHLQLVRDGMKLDLCSLFEITIFLIALI